MELHKNQKAMMPMRVTIIFHKISFISDLSRKKKSKKRYYRKHANKDPTF